MTACKFYQQGNCRYGKKKLTEMTRLDNCRFEHAGPANNGRNQPANRFGALGGGAGGGQAAGSGGSAQAALAKYNISAEIIERDLSTERPQWILSAYAPGRDAPDQLFGGYPREQSFEELRLHYMNGKASGNEQEALNQAQELYQTAEQQMQNALRNAGEAAQFIVGGEDRHPNRADICREGTHGAPFGEFLVGKRPKTTVAAEPAQANPFGQSTSAPSQSTFGQPAAQAPSAFGQPSTLGQRPNPFGSPPAGQPSQPVSGFGQSSQPQPQQQQPPSAFGQPAQGGSGFGQPAQPASGFGQPSALGPKPSPFGAPAFGQPSQPNAQGNAFGQPSQMGQNPNPFASNTTNTNASPFATAGGNASKDPPAQNPFASGGQGQGQGNNTPNPFASAPGNQNINNANPFGQPQQTTQPTQAASPFGQPAAAAPNPFATANQAPASNANNPFAQKTGQQPGGFASQANQPQQKQQQQQQQNSSPFGQSSVGNTAFGQPAKANPFEQPSNPAHTAANPFASGQQPPQQQQPPQKAAGNTLGHPYPPGSSKQHPPIESYSSKTMDGRLSSFKGKPVGYKGGKPGIRAFDGTWSRIWFPEGAPGYYKDTELPPEDYDDKSKKEWASFAQTGNFAGGLMPALPPLRECTQWDF